MTLRWAYKGEFLHLWGGGWRHDEVGEPGIGQERSGARSRDKGRVKR